MNIDYKDILVRLKCPDDIEKCTRLKKYQNSCVWCRDEAMKDAASAIETLLAEREDSRLTPKMVTCSGGWKGTRLTRYYCPQCKKAVRNDEAYCHKCGQAILFPKQEYDKENNKIWLNFE